MVASIRGIRLFALPSALFEADLKKPRQIYLIKLFWITKVGSCAPLNRSVPVNFDDRLIHLCQFFRIDFLIIYQHCKHVPLVGLVDLYVSIHSVVAAIVLGLINSSDFEPV